ncbi:AbrB/MazE/SpoVT family DNA-binding domain-containing protein [Thermofilum pendens]|uniref:Transcriptional regulator, AbrB family n=1 Tax=Thermofilum pendens (strain DSM 2475 / Hrk 5) TaxID=368408 RepID=A1S095_THEPD|nr:AbrB/MazE/SpoVT family DNA-binding domain-containing protein [Thermofilum pendens]ABL78875.1 transcriptional regulator, AbrB family [Thermofilum pendens Hrk 5]
MKTVVSRKGQVVIPKEVREKLGLVPGTVLRVRVEGKRVVLEPVEEPPREVFVEAGPEVTGRLLREAKLESDKALRLLRDLGVEEG